MHDGMPNDSIHGQGHEPFKIVNPAIFKFQQLSPPPFTMGASNRAYNILHLKIILLCL